MRRRIFFVVGQLKKLFFPTPVIVIVKNRQRGQMKTRLNFKKILAALFLLFILGFVAAYCMSPQVAWRTRTVGLKLTGQIEELSWKNFVLASLPERYLSCKPTLMNLFSPNAFMKIKYRNDKEGCPILWGTPYGDYWGHADDGPVIFVSIREQLLTKAYETRPVHVKKGDVVLDVGGYLGTFTRYALYHGARQVIVFEPSPPNIECFKKTFEKELSDKRVVLIEAAAWDSQGELEFEILTDAAMAHVPNASLVKGVATIKVPAVTIDDIVARLGLDHVDFVKMDIEGAERQALIGAQKTMKQFKPRMAICTYHLPDDRDVIPDIILKACPDYHKILKSEQTFFF